MNFRRVLYGNNENGGEMRNNNYLRKLLSVLCLVFFSLAVFSPAQVEAKDMEERFRADIKRLRKVAGPIESEIPEQMRNSYYRLNTTIGIASTGDTYKYYAMREMNDFIKRLEAFKRGENEGEVIGELISKGAVVRDSKGKRVGYISPGKLINYTRIDKNKVYFMQKNKLVSVSRLYTNKKYEEVLFVSKGANVRDADGKKIEYFPPGQVIIGGDCGYYIEVDVVEYRYQDVIIGFVDKSRLEDYKLKTNYKSKGVRVRNSKGKQIGYLKPGEKVKGTREGSYVRIKYKGQSARVHSSFLI